MSKFATFLIVGNIVLGSFTFATGYAATTQACQTARLAGKTPSNSWVGTLDTPANEAQLSQYCFSVEVGTPSFLASMVMLMFTVSSSGLYFLLKVMKVI
jgi:hypothetical protein